MNEEDANPLPYNLDIKLFEDILNDLKTAGPNGIKLGTLWVNVSAAKNVNRSYTLNMAKYLDLVDTDKTNVWLTDIGIQSFKYASGEKRRTILALNMPDRYKTIFKWIKNAGELSTSAIKGEFVRNLGGPKSTLIFDKAITTFLTYCDYLKIITYTGKGNAAKATITEYGRTVLDQDAGETKIDIAETKSKSESLNQTKISELQKGTYPIIIKTPDREIPYDIRTENDFTVIDAIFKSIKEDWNKLQKGHSKEVVSKGS